MYNRGIMTPLREWLKPPKSLLLILFLLTLVSVSALGWFGFKLLEQDRMVQAQQRQERLEQAADRIAATQRGTLAETGERLSAWLAAPPAAGKPRGRHSADRRRQRGDGVSGGKSTLLPGAGERSRRRPRRSFRGGRIARISAGAAGARGGGVPPTGGIRRPGRTGRRAAAAGARARQTGAARGERGGLHADGGDRRRAGGRRSGGPGGAARARRPGAAARTCCADAGG